MDRNEFVKYIEHLRSEPFDLHDANYQAYALDALIELLLHEIKNV